MVTELVLIRHGEIDANVQRLWHGTTDSELNARGLAQIAALGERFHQKYPNITKVYSSPLKRTLRTAEAVAQGLGLSPVIHPQLIEFGIGTLEGTSYEDLDAQHDFFSKIAADHDYALPGGESINAVSQRMQAGVASLIEAHPGERLVLVGHGAAFGILLAGYLDGKPFPFHHHHLSNTGIAHLKYSDKAELFAFDDIEHLADL